VKRSLSPQGRRLEERKISPVPAWLSLFAWGVAVVMIAFTLFLLVKKAGSVLSAPAVSTQTATAVETPVVAPTDNGQTAGLPDFQFQQHVDAIVRFTNTHTIAPSRSRVTADQYTVQKGDSIFGIAKKYELNPESVLWANYDVLKDDPHLISLGQELRIPPADGVWYEWKAGDSIDKVAGEFRAEPNDILTWPGNKLDFTNPTVEPGSMIMIPGGEREMRQWVVAIPFTPKSGVTRSMNGPGACELSAGGAYGSGSFIWPAANQSLSGNDFWSGHKAVDIAAGTGAPVYATDSGVVVYAGPVGGGYGIAVMIDHNNGYQSLYAHLSSTAVVCGQSVGQGGTIGYAGSTGNSTGPHLHFEVRYLGGFINPWQVLP